jgi:acyl carrier protein
MSVERVEKVFREVFEKPELRIHPGMTAAEVDNWDSFNHINLVVALEDTFAVTLTTEEIASMANVGDLVKVLQKKGIAVSWN